MLKKPAVVMVETKRAIDLLVWLRAANTPPMMRMTSRPTPVTGMALSATRAAPDPELLAAAAMCVTGRAELLATTATIAPAIGRMTV